jgi:hypothetical protein
LAGGFPALGVVVEERGPFNAGRFQMVAKPLGQAVDID